MQENETAPDAAAASASATEESGGETSTTPAATEEITYHAVEKDGQVTAIWEMQGRKHLRTIDPRSRQGQDILRLYTADHGDETSASDAASES
jgi:hypothetical protein